MWTRTPQAGPVVHRRRVFAGAHLQPLHRRADRCDRGGAAGEAGGVTFVGWVERSDTHRFLHPHWRWVSLALDPSYASCILRRRKRRSEGGAPISIHVIASEAKRSIYPRVDAWIASLRSAMTAACCIHELSRSRGAFRPRFCNSFTPFNQEGAGNAGCRLAPAVSCANSAEDTHTSIQVQPEQPGIPCAMGLRLIPCSPWRRIPLASIAGGLKALRNPVGFRKTSAGLTPATGARTTRLCRPRSRRSSARGLRSQA